MASTFTVPATSRRVALLVIVSLGLFLIWGTLAHGQNYNEHQVKAAFLAKLHPFVKWPEPLQESEQITIGLLGATMFKPYVKDIEGQNIKGKKIIVKQIASVREAKHCHIVFIGPSEKDRLGYILSSLSSSPVLTVSDSEGWAKQGVMVNFYMDEGAVRVEVNVDTAKNAGLILSAHFLKLARIQR